MEEPKVDVIIPTYNRACSIVRSRTGNNISSSSEKEMAATVYIVNKYQNDMRGENCLEDWIVAALRASLAAGSMIV